MQNTEWKFVDGYEGIYKINRAGEIMTCSPNPIIKKVSINDAGYPICLLNKGGKIKMFRVHRLIAIAFIPNPQNKPYVNHINGIRNDNRIENLEWVTPAENIKHSFDVLGRIPVCGVRCGTAKINENDVSKILELHQAGFSQRAIERQIGKISRWTIRKILDGKIWKSVPRAA